MTTVTTRMATPRLSRRAAMLVLAGSVLAALVIAVLTLGGGGASGPLRWSGDGEVFTHPTLPGDRVLTGTLRNDGVQAMRIDLADGRVIDFRRRGRGLDAGLPWDLSQVDVGRRSRPERSDSAPLQGRVGLVVPARRCRSPSPGAPRPAIPFG